MTLYRTVGAILIAAAASLSVAGGALAQQYPTSPIKLIVPYSPGGNGDISARLIGGKVAEILGAQISIENKPGGGAYIGLNQCANAPADGYTVCFVSTSPIVISPHMTDAPYNPVEDFTYIGQYGIATQPLVVRNDGAYNSLQDLLDHGRANPGQLRWSAAAFLGGPHLATEAMFRAEGVQTVYLPSQGGAVELANLLAGTIDLAVIADYAAALAAGQVKLIGETTPVRNPNAPDIETFQELGYPLSPAVFIGFAGPAGIPQEAVDAWDAALAQALTDPEVVELMARINTLIVHKDSAEFTAQIQNDFAVMGEVLAELDIQQAN